MPEIRTTTPAPPLPPTAEASTRWEHTRLRERIMGSVWEDDLRRELAQELGTLRSRAQGVPDQSSNLLKACSQQLSTLYHRPPTVTHATGAEELVDSGGILTRAGLWQIMGSLQQQIIALNDYLLGITISPDGRPIYRPVSPSYVVAVPDPNEPDLPIAISELRLRAHPQTGAWAWYWDAWDLRVPSFRVMSATTNEAPVDVTALFIQDGETGEPLADLSGDRYPYLDDGRPILPYSLYHAERTGGCLFSPFLNSEIVQATLKSGAGYSMFWKAFKDSSYSQRYTVNCAIPGLGTDGTTEAPRSSITTDPSTILMLSSEDDSQPMVGAWQPASTPGELLDSLTKYELRAAEFMGISPADIQRLGGSNNARSGVAISLSREAQRESARRFTPVMRRSDLETIEKTAGMLNAATGSSWPTDGYHIRYAAIPRSSDELEAERRHVVELLQSGLISRVEALQFLEPGMSREEALRRLDEIRRINLSTSVA